MLNYVIVTIIAVFVVVVIKVVVAITVIIIVPELDPTAALDSRNLDH